GSPLRHPFLARPRRVTLVLPGPIRSHIISRIMGETEVNGVEISENTVRVNGVALDEPYINGTAFYRSASWTVPHGHYFVMGDNRNHSSDSRVLSFVSRDDVVGRAWLIYWGIEN